MLRALVLSLLMVAPSRASNPPPPPRDAVITSPKIETVKKELSAQLAKFANGGKITSRSEPGPLGLVVITAAVEHAYPGSGVFRLLIDDAGVTYGVHGEKDFADLLRAHPCTDAPTLVKLVDYTFFEGVAMLMDTPAPTAKSDHGTLVITFYRTWHPSGGKTRVQVTVPASGKAQVQSVNEK